MSRQSYWQKICIYAKIRKNLGKKIKWNTYLDSAVLNFKPSAHSLQIPQKHTKQTEKGNKHYRSFSETLKKIVTRRYYYKLIQIYEKNAKITWFYVQILQKIKKKTRKSSCNCYWRRRNILPESNDKEIQFLVWETQLKQKISPMMNYMKIFLFNI